jgi:hypothetical protein
MPKPCFVASESGSAMLESGFAVLKQGFVALEQGFVTLESCFVVLEATISFQHQFSKFELPLDPPGAAFRETPLPNLLFFVRGNGMRVI